MPNFPDCYDQWSLEKVDHGCYETIYEGTEEECREYAHTYFTFEEYKDMVLMDWEGREWEV